MHRTQASVESQPAKGARDLGAHQQNSDCHLLNGVAVARGDWELEEDDAGCLDVQGRLVAAHESPHH